MRNKEKLLGMGDAWLNLDTTANLPLKLYTFKVNYCGNFQGYTEKGA